MERWAIVFQITAAFGLIATVIFGLYGSGKVQYWNEPQDKRKDANEADKEDEELASLREPLNHASGDSKA
jgi:hypothetical protein